MIVVYTLHVLIMVKNRHLASYSTGLVESTEGGRGGGGGGGGGGVEESGAGVIFSSPDRLDSVRGFSLAVFSIS